MAKTEKKAVKASAKAPKKEKEEKKLSPEDLNKNEETSEPEEEEQEEKLENEADEEPEEAKEADTPEDYLRQYQVKVVSGAQIQGGVKSDPTPGSKADLMKQRLLSQEKVKMYVPRAQGESKKVLQSVTLNGYRMDFPKGAYILVPKQVADLLDESLNLTEAAVERNKIDGDEDKESKLL